MNDRQRFMSNVKVALGGCWNWQGYRRANRYGSFYLKGRQRTAHRLMYSWVVGTIPDKFIVHHTCENMICMNPDHLRAVSHSEHAFIHPERFHNRRKTHCPKGHPYSGDNLVFRYNNRKCKICVTARERKRKRPGRYRKEVSQ